MRRTRIGLDGKVYLPGNKCDVFGWIGRVMKVLDKIDFALS